MIGAAALITYTKSEVMILQKFRRWIAGALAALLLVAVPARSLAVVAYAVDPVSASVAVGAGGGLGLAAANVVGATIAAGVLAACGIKAYVNAADAAGMTKTEYLGSLMQQWSQIEYDNAQQLQEDIAYSTYVTADGALHIKSAAAQKIKAFGDWLVNGGTDHSVPVSSSPTAFYSTMGGIPVSGPLSSFSVSASTWGYRYRMADSSSFYALMYQTQTGSKYLDLLWPSGSFLQRSSDGGASWQNVSNGGSTAGGFSRTEINLNNAPLTLSLTPPLHVGNIPFASLGGLSTGIDSGIIGNPIDWATNEDVINLGGTDVGAVTVTPDLLNQLDLSGVATDVVIGLQSYIDSLVAAINGLKDKVVTLEDALTLENVATIPVPDAIDTSISVPTNPAITIPQDAVGVIDGQVPAPPPPVPPGDKIIADYSYDLTSVFPFCIPFDIVRALRLLDAQPEAPKASFTWKIPLVGLDYTMEFDLSPWSGVAQVLRTMELLVFTIGLGLVSRKLIMA